MISKAIVVSLVTTLPLLREPLVDTIFFANLNTNTIIIDSSVISIVELCRMHCVPYVVCSLVRTTRNSLLSVFSQE